MNHETIKLRREIRHLLIELNQKSGALIWLARKINVNKRLFWHAMSTRSGPKHLEALEKALNYLKEVV